MKILFIGDIVGKKGREVVIDNLLSIKKDYDLVIGNGENSAHGKGITYKIYNQLREAGIDVITLGNHAFSKADIYEHITLMDRLIQPINHTKSSEEGQDYIIVNVCGKRLCICNILGEALMNEVKCSPYEAMNQILSETKGKCDFYFVDLHAEATAEKRLFAEYYKDKCIAVIGTHTHVQTADERIIDGCAFISDAGMCGAYDSIIGRDIDECIKANILKQPTRYTIAENKAIFSAIEVVVEEDRAVEIKRLQVRPY